METRHKSSYSLMNSWDSTTCCFWMTSTGSVSKLKTSIYTRTPEAATKLVPIMQKGQCWSVVPTSDPIQTAPQMQDKSMWNFTPLGFSGSLHFPERSLTGSSGSCNGMQLVYWFFVFGEINRVRLFAFLISIETKIWNYIPMFCHNRLWRNIGIFAKNSHNVWSFAVDLITKRICRRVARKNISFFTSRCCINCRVSAVL